MAAGLRKYPVEVLKVLAQQRQISFDGHQRENSSRVDVHILAQKDFQLKISMGKHQNEEMLHNELPSNVVLFGNLRSNRAKKRKAIDCFRKRKSCGRSGDRYMRMEIEGERGTRKSTA